jgi:glutamyl-tRNA synthetase
MTNGKKRPSSIIVTMLKFNYMKVRTRFAPSPTGSLHVGSLRTALYAYALAKHEHGDFLLRIEDTDQKREVQGAREELEKVLKQFGITWDEQYVQSERAKEGLYKKAADKLVSERHAFYCQCEAKNAKTEGFSKILRDPCRDKGLTSGAIKLRVPDNETISYYDFVFRKEVTWKTDVVADTTLLKSDGILATYHLAVVVDDTDMQISHVLRGHDWLPSTPIHLLVYKYLGFELPQIGHLTDILDPAGGKLSKRKGSTTCEGLLKEGYLVEAIRNFVLLLGWAPKDNRELYPSIEEIVEGFSLEGLQKSNPKYNPDKLNWFNQQYIGKLSNEELAQRIGDFYDNKYSKEAVEKIAPFVKSRLWKLTDFESIAGYIFEEKEPLKLTDNYEEHVTKALQSLEQLDNWTVEDLNITLMKVVTDNGYKTGDFFMDLRGAIAGSKVTPPMNDTLVIMGKGEVIKRLTNALSK